MAVDRNLDNVVLSLRLKGAEAVRFWHVMDAAKDRNPYCDKSHVIRELFGLDKPDLLTTAEVEHFRSGGKRNANGNIEPISEQKIVRVPRVELTDETKVKNKLKRNSVK